MRVEVSGVSIEIDRTRIVSDVELVVSPGSVHGLIGPNGSGKSTLLRAIYRAVRPVAGAIRLGDDDLWAELGAREAARRRAVVAQESPLDLDFTVRDVVLMGRAPHKGPFERDNERDRRIVGEALDLVRMSWASDRSATSLSGGERQRVLLARALAQQASILVLDEPTNHLDVRAQLDLLELVVQLDMTVIMALHDLDHAASTCDHLTVLDAGRVVASGPTADVLQPALIRSVFGVDAHIGPHPITGRAHVATAPLQEDTP